MAKSSFPITRPNGEDIQMVSVGFFCRVEVRGSVAAMRHGGIPLASHWTSLGCSLVSTLGSLPSKGTLRSWTAYPRGKKTNASGHHKA